MAIAERAAPRRRGSSSPPLAAALDLGTNNCRLLIAQLDAAGPRVIDAFSRVVRLGAGAAQSGVLAGDAIERTIGALRVCAAKLRRHRPRYRRLVATEACRAALNRQPFLDRVLRETGLRLDVIEPEEEARLALLGCAALLEPAAPRALMFDIGGGSTELLWLELAPAASPTIRAMTSIAIGVVSLTDRLKLADDAAPRAELVAALQRFDQAHGIAPYLRTGAAQVLGGSGTITTLAGIHLGLPRYDRAQVDGMRMTGAEISAVIGRVRGLGEQGRRAHPSIGSARADLVSAGCVILGAIMEVFPAASVRVADRGVREGILIDLMMRHDADSGRSGPRPTAPAAAAR